MMTSIRRWVSGCAAVLMVAGLAACSDGSSSDDTTPSPSKSVGAPISQAKAEGHLLKVSDVDKSLFKVDTFTPYNHALPCSAVDGPGIASTTKATFDIGVNLVSTKPSATVTEEVLGFADLAAAKSAMLTIRDGFSCVTGTRYVGSRTEVTSIGPIQDYAHTVGAGEAYAWQQATKKDVASQVAMLCRTTIILFRYSAGLTVDFSQLPKGETVAKRAYAKMRKA